MGGQSTAGRGRRALAKREQRLAALAGRQHGVVSRRQLLAAGLSNRTIERRVTVGRLHRLHRGVFAFGHDKVGLQGQWMAAVLAGGEDALLSHRSAAALWGLTRPPRGVIEVTAARGRGRPRLVIHEGGVSDEDRTVRNGIPVTTVARTLFDLAEVVDDDRVGSVFEEADRLGLLRLRALEGVCARGHGRRALRVIRPLLDAARTPAETRSPLEGRFVRFCREHELPQPQTNVLVLGYEVDAYWPKARLVVESDSWLFHRHRAAFERDRVRDAALQSEGYRVIRVTSRRLEGESAALAAEIRRLLKVGTIRAVD